MNILIAPDKFKGSLNAQQVCEAIAEGIHDAQPSSIVIISPMADGGEGTCEILTSISGGKLVECQARDPLFREIKSAYGLSPDGKTAFIEMAKASGLQLLKENERNPMETSSIGTGDLIADALKHKVDTIILGCGGSATNDGGLGMASALGVSLLDENKKTLRPVGRNLSRIKSIQAENLNPQAAKCRFILLNDVNNPLTGKDGASFVFGKQKGASDEDVLQLDAGLRNLAAVINNPELTNFAGAGAAGGFPVSVKTFLKAEIQSGVEYIMTFSAIEQKIRNTDLVITGEGKFDNQSLGGKVIKGLSQLCLKYKRPLWVMCGMNEVPADELKNLGIEKVIALADSEDERKPAIRNAKHLLRRKIAEILSS